MEPVRIGIGIGDRVLDLRWCAQANLLPNWACEAISTGSLNTLMGFGLDSRVALRRRLSELLSANCRDLRDQAMVEEALPMISAVEFQLPCHIGDYTDFYASMFHATNVGSMFRPDNPLLPNYKYIPIGYHGRASSIVVSGHDIRRPRGQLPPAGEGAGPSFGPCQNLDYELEVGCYIAQGNSLGTSISIERADDSIFGVGLVNDWSARDMQRWEYQPLGPFLAKSFSTTISPWIVTMEALQPFRCSAFTRPAGDPQPLPYLMDARNESAGGINLELEVLLSTEKMRAAGAAAHRVSLSNFATMYWTLAQMVAHHTSNGCNLQPGDLLASGTVSGPERSSRGCLLELTWDGEYGQPVPGSQRTPLQLPSGERRTFLQDGDEVTFRGRCTAEGFRSIGFGECRGRVAAAVE